MCIIRPMKEWEWIDLPSVGSTNDEAVKYSHEHAKDKFVVTAYRQENGRGRRGRSWIGLEGNLFMSLGVEIPLHRLGQFIFVVTLALAQSIKTLSPRADVKLKWPNDVLVQGRKISGILLEKGARDYIIAGIGVNVKHAPDLVGKSYRSISLSEIGIEIERLELLDLYLSCFDNLFELWERKGFEPLREQWLNMAKGIGETITVVQEQAEKRGIFSGVDSDGLLLLDVNGKIEKICAGDVFFKENKNI